MSTPAITLYSFPLSGHAHRVTLMLSLLGLPYRRVDVDLRGGEHKQPPFLALNAFGQVPVLEDEGAVIADSNAILVYLAKRYQGQARWLPEDALGAAAVQRWLSVAAGQLASGPNAARLATLFGVPDPGGAAQARTHALLAVMDAELGRRDWLAGEAATIADVACYAYVALAPEGNVSLQDYSRVRAWLARVEALPGFVPMAFSHVGLRAA
ncbi:glutathione S-transferase [Achromobacter sp. Marseille-Q0513]|uniref:glutathione S-transferase family protein n=1 Tax=Achromobacter sp. Marseille-Q0513 TaxID=2829161 RepID=UPI001B92FA2D|nr:glutathione S-transferase [Achromobacter sp. Marseille-Q0513]MBR8656661.1 glutathione S-transferase [Achromobacter sp. Marseille-Q0513]